MATGNQADLLPVEFSILNFKFSILWRGELSKFSSDGNCCSEASPREFSEATSAPKAFEGNGIFPESVARYLRKYQLESKNVSHTSVSRFANPLHFGHLEFTNLSS